MFKCCDHVKECSVQCASAPDIPNNCTCTPGSGSRHSTAPLIHIVYSLVMFTRLVPRPCISLHTWFQLKTSFINIVNNCSGTLGSKSRHSIVHLLVYSSSLSGLVYTVGSISVYLLTLLVPGQDILYLTCLSVNSSPTHSHYPTGHYLT